MRQKIVLLLTFLLTFCFSCSRKSVLSVRKVNSDEIGKEVVCPVTKNKFKVVPETKAVDYKGKTYYFCCPGCDSQFIKEPEKYISVSPSTINHQLSTILYWTCSMHPQVKQNKPGKCPICGMDLIAVYKGEEDKIVVDEEKIKLLGIKSEEVKVRPIVKTLRLPGKVAYDNDLYLAQQEYLSSFYNLQKIKDEEQKNRIKETLEAAKFRLYLLGYTDDDIEKLQQFKEPDKNLIYPGNKVWMHAEIYEYDLAMVKPGQNVVATTLAYPSEKFKGVVRFVEPVLNPQTRSAKARIEFDNSEGKLKLEMYADLEIKINLGRHLSIPATSLIDTGTRKVVYLDLGNGRYKMQEVKTGFEADGYVQVLSGLKEGDKVVTDGNFMLDSQSTLTGGQALLYGGAKEVKSEKVEPQEVEHKH
ncbi:MAG: efflux RND transporter periplasmic adaptor subunit [Candidatus Aenigmatarchaeota archaeon]